MSSFLLFVASHIHGLKVLFLFVCGGGVLLIINVFFFFVIGGFGSDLCESETDLWQFSLSLCYCAVQFRCCLGIWLVGFCCQLVLTMDLLGLVVFGIEITCI